MGKNLEAGAPGNQEKDGAEPYSPFLNSQNNIICNLMTGRQESLLCQQRKSFKTLERATLLFLERDKLGVGAA